MCLLIVLWALAVTAGLCWVRWAAIVASLAAMAGSIITNPGLFRGPLGWVELVAFGVTPWLLAEQRGRFQRRVRRFQGREAVRLSRLHAMARTLLERQAENQRLESQTSGITELYHVTKETARANRVGELFNIFLDLLPRLLAVQGVRLIDVSPGAEGTRVFRSSRLLDGRLEPDTASAPTANEEIIARRAMQRRAVGRMEPQELAEHSAAAGAGVAWAPLWVEQTIQGVLVVDGLPDDAMGTLTIVANQVALQLARVHLYQAVESMAITDSLTGLSVRRYFLELANEELNRSKRHELPCTLLMVDLDLFKHKNDTYGHLVGDVVLHDVAQLLHRNLRDIDLIARYGGEEFTLLLIETSPEQAMPVAERLRQLVELQPVRAYDETLQQTISLGLASFPEDGDTLEILMSRADEALYAAKRAGRNRVMRWSPECARIGQANPNSVSEA